MSDVPALILPREDEIKALIAGGLHPVKISRIMAQRGTMVTPEQVYELTRSLDFKPEPSPLKKYVGIDRLSDVHQELHHLVLIEEDRVVQLLREENGDPRPSTNAYLNQLFRHLKELAELEHVLGISPHEATALADNQPRNLQTLREMIKARKDSTVTLERITVEPNG